VRSAGSKAERDDELERHGYQVEDDRPQVVRLDPASVYRGW